MTRYYIFKTDNLTGRTILICNGSHASEAECNLHFHAYMYGFYDGCVEALGSGKFQFMDGTKPNSFIFSVEGKMNVEYFMLLDEDGVNLIKEIA